MSASLAVSPQKLRERREVIFSLCASVLAHLLILLLALVLLAAGLMTTPPPPPAPLPEMEVTFLAPPPLPVAEAPPQFIDSTGAELADSPPENARFESDRDTRAASSSPAVNQSDLPSQEGRDDPFLELTNQDLSLGPQQTAAIAPQPASLPAEAAPPKTAESQTPPAPTESQVVEEAKEETISPLPPDAIALEKPREVRRAEPLAPAGVRQETRRAEVPREVSREAAARTAGFQPERRTTRIQGGVSNRGRSSVEATGTPLGRYKKQLSDAIGSRWYFYVSDQLALLSVGTLTLRFTVLENGRVTDVQILSNSSNESFASVSIRSIMEADIPPIPPEVLEFLDNQRIEVDYTFSILGN